MHVQRWVLACSLALAIGACASHGRERGAGGGSDANVITAEEIAAAHATSAFHAIWLLRAEHLNVRGPVSVEDPAAALPTVFVDDMAYGTLAALRQIPASDVAEIRFLSAWDAATRYGSRHRGGVIVVTTKR